MHDVSSGHRHCKYDTKHCSVAIKNDQGAACSRSQMNSEKIMKKAAIGIKIKLVSAYTE